MTSECSQIQPPEPRSLGVDRSLQSSRSETEAQPSALSNKRERGHGSVTHQRNHSHHRRILLASSAAATLLTLTLTLLAARLPLFDASPQVLLPDPPPESDLFSRISHTLASAVLRWDAFHFAHVAADNYVYEHEWAFFPGMPLHVMPGAGRLVGFLKYLGAYYPPRPRTEDVLLGGLVASAALTWWSVVPLYDLSVEVLGSSDAAFLAAALSLLPSSPVTLRIAGPSEPFFTFFSYTGMLSCIRRRWLSAALHFFVAGTFRSTGFFLSGFLIWGMLVEPIINGHRVSLTMILYATALSALTIVPFMHHQYAAYQLFCTHTREPASWCGAFPPFVYTYVQAKYWNVGFLRYWTVQQLPNFLLGAPPLALLFAFSLYHIRQALLPRLREVVSAPVASSGTARTPTTPSAGSIHKSEPARTGIQAPSDAAHDRRHSRSTSTTPTATPTPASTSTSTSTPIPAATSCLTPFLRSSITPHAIHALAMSLLLLFASHTQIVLRQAASMPLTYWAAAWLLVERPRMGRLWVGWSVVWGAVSCVLWGVFLPPA
ncbi:GPI mannosyltransferase 2 [Daedaleopsis nitida]|nr:GPI mannosyltransferase 2 [Daedaleopsis nitida]